MFFFFFFFFLEGQGDISSARKVKKHNKKDLVDFDEILCVGTYYTKDFFFLDSQGQSKDYKKNPETL